MIILYGDRSLSGIIADHHGRIGISGYYQPVGGGSKVPVDHRIGGIGPHVDKDITVSVSYIMILKGGTWMVYDIVVEGVSLVRNYMDQFKEILRKEGYDKLLKQVEDKVTELEQAIGRPCPVEILEKNAS